MRVSKKSQYALKAILELASRQNGQPVKTRDIGLTQGISPHFLEVILNELKRGGFVASRRGKEGGYVLAWAASELTVGEVLRFLEGTDSVATESRKLSTSQPAVFGDSALARLWAAIDKAASVICDTTTFAELIEYEASVSKKALEIVDYVI